MTLPVAILAGGLAKRMRPATERIPKALIEVAGRPFVHHQIELLRRHGYARLVFCVGYLGESIEQELGDGSGFGVSIAYSFDGPQLLGTGGALRKALPLLSEAFLVMYGDSYLDCDFASVERHFRESGKLGLMTVHRNAGRWDKSNVEYRDGRILRYDKVNRTKEMEYIDYGLGALREDAFLEYSSRHSLRHAFDLAELYQTLLARDELGAFEVTRRFYEVGSQSGLMETEQFLKSKDEGR